MKKTIIIGCAFSALIGWGCSSSTHEGHDHSEHAGEADHKHTEACEQTEVSEPTEKESHADEIIFGREQAKEAGLVVKEIAPSDFNQVIKVTGRILAAQGDETTVAATMAGIVSFGKTNVVEGTAVSQGATLLSLSARKMVDGDPSANARINYETARKEYERMQILVKDKIVSEKEFSQARQAYETARVAYEAVAGNKASSGVNIAAPMSGFVKSRLVNEGDFVQAGQPLLSISKNRRLVLRAEVPEKYYSSLSSIGSANFKTPYDDNVYRLADLNGRILTYGRASGDNSFYVPVTFEFDNKGNIIPGSYVEIYLLSKPMSGVITVPLTALVEEQGNYFVYLQLDEEGYKKQPVTLGVSDGKNVQIASGVKAGDKIVTQGAYQVKLAASSSVIPEGHSHNH